MGAKGRSGTRRDWVERKAGCYAPSLKTPAVDAVYYDNTQTTIREVTSGHDEEFVDDGIITSVEVAPDERGQNSILARLFDRLHKFSERARGRQCDRWSYVITERFSDRSEPVLVWQIQQICTPRVARGEAQEYWVCLNDT